MRSKNASGGRKLLRMGHPPSNGHLEDHEGDKADDSAGDVEQPEGRGRHRAEPFADIADHLVGEEKGQIVDADHRGVDRPGRDLGEEREADRQYVREADRVQQVEHDRPEQPDFA